MPALRRWWAQDLTFHLPVRDLLIPLLLLALAAGTFYWRLGEGSLYDWDEGIHAQMAQEMLWSHDLLTPHLAGAVHFTKPPLYLWQTVLAYKVFGVNEFAARFWAALSGVGAVLMTYLLGRDLFNRAAGTAAALLLLTVNNLPYSHGYSFVSIGRMAMMTTPLAFYALVTVWLAWRGERDRRYIALIGLPLGAAVMTKNVAGLLPLIALLAYWAVTWPRRQWPWREWGLALILLLAISLPWHISQALAYGQRFFQEYIFHNLLERAATTIDIQYHQQPPWFYLDVIRQGFSYAAWALPPAALLAGYRALRRREPGLILLLFWALVPLAVYSASSTKLGWYIVEAYPALALLLAWFLVTLLGQQWGVALVVAFLVFFGWRLPSPRDGSPDAKAVAPAVRYLAGKDQEVLLCMRGGDHPAPAMLFYAGRPVKHVLYGDGGLQRALPGASWLLTDADTWQAAGLSGRIVCQSGSQLLVQLQQP